MRDAQVRRTWQKIQKKADKATPYLNLHFRNVAGVADGNINFDSPMSILCGPNGVGKTALLKSIWATLSWSQAERVVGVKERLKGAECRVNVDFDGVNIDTGFIDVINDGKDMSLPNDAEVIHIDGSRNAADIQKFFCEQQAIGEMLEGLDEVNLNDEMFSEVKYVMGKEYDELKFFDIDEFSYPIPFIVVKEFSESYDITTMGLGEISLLYFMWMLWRMPARSILLVEEPEVFVSPKAQLRLMNVMAKYANDRGIRIIMTSHSPFVVGLVPLSGVRYLYKRAGGSTHVYREDGVRDSLTGIGLTPRKDILVLVEDVVARHFFELWLARIDPSLVRRIVVRDMGGEANITVLASKYPIDIEDMRLVDVFDGDLRERKMGEGVVQYMRSFLPFEVSLEEKMRAVALADPEALAKALRRDREAVEVILGELHGIELHDWLEELARGVGLSVRDKMVGLLDLLWDDADCIEELKRAAGEFRDTVNE